MKDEVVVHYRCQECGDILDLACMVAMPVDAELWAACADCDKDRFHDREEVVTQRWATDAVAALVGLLDTWLEGFDNWPARDLRSEHAVRRLTFVRDELRQISGH